PKESLDSVLRVVGSVYGVQVGVVDGSAPAPRKSAGRPRKAAGRPRKSAGRPRKTAAASSGRGRRSAAPSPTDVRAWARANGHTVSDRGRLPAPIIDAYLAAQ
ncbi:MAG TPA: histone-like nucleoid-structuring protein Lsr2, partial [Mycobacteriales bacterium]|nr:histone-like nucleoid-structuring protein Lsr2 [Mycobacteriales bacterium]